MSFNLVRTIQPIVTDMRNVYKLCAEEFCKYYYATYDSNFNNLWSVYYTDSQFTYLDSEMVGFDNLCNGLRLNGVLKFTHNNLVITAQPVGSAHLLITVVGTVAFNDTIFQNKFIETLLLHRHDSNRLYVCNTIFKLTD